MKHEKTSNSLYINELLGFDTIEDNIYFQRISSQNKPALSKKENFDLILELSQIHSKVGKEKQS